MITHGPIVGHEVDPAALLSRPDLKAVGLLLADRRTRTTRTLWCVLADAPHDLAELLQDLPSGQPAALLLVGEEIVALLSHGWRGTLWVQRALDELAHAVAQVGSLEHFLDHCLSNTEAS